jgi:hypothetical protein
MFGMPPRDQRGVVMSDKSDGAQTGAVGASDRPVSSEQGRWD